MRPDTSSRKEGPRLTALSVVGVLRPVHLDAFSWRSRWVLPALRLNPTSGGSARVDQQAWRDSCAVAVAGDSARWSTRARRAGSRILHPLAEIANLNTHIAGPKHLGRRHSAPRVPRGRLRSSGLKPAKEALINNLFVSRRLSIC
jgi:hypothetical protein